MKKFIDPIIDEDFYCVVAPDGSIQPSSLAPDEPTCIAFLRTMHKKGIGQSYHELKAKGFTIEKVKVTIAGENKIRGES